MKGEIHTSAPGKLLILGEYAVLEGAPALVSAVGRRAYVTLQPSPTWRLSAPQLGLNAFELDTNGEVPGDAPAQIRRVLQLYAAVRHTVNDCLGAQAPLHIHIDTGEFFHGAHKIGIGSSAAVAVALTGALAAALDQRPDCKRLFDLAAQAHQRAQGGVGSNADIAASVYGGCLMYRINSAPTPARLPDELILQAVFTGHAASTPDLVGAVYRLREQNPDEFRHRMQQLAELAQRGCTACLDNDVNAMLATAGLYHTALEVLGQAAGVGIISASHKKLNEITNQTDTTYKPSGAGGGDIGLLFLRRLQDRAPLMKKVIQAGFEPLDLTLCASGFKVL